MTAAGPHRPAPPRDARGPLLAERAPIVDPRGQASVEVIAFLPLVVLIALAAFTAIAAHAAEEQAGEAAEAGALVLLQGGGDARTAAKEALPEKARGRATIRVEGRRVHVRVRPRLALGVPGLAERLAGDARAHAGPLAP